MEKALIIFLKYPELGRSKTRLAATIGNENALKVYIELLNHTHLITKDLKAIKYLYYDKVTEQLLPWQENYFVGFQPEADLGMRMKNAFTELFYKGYNKVVIIGSDCYELSTEIIESAYDLLNEYDVVIGPAKDGGYYLLGMNKLYPELFNDVAWSTDKVLNASVEIIKKLNLTYQTLPILSDIDVEDDLPNDLNKLIS